ncbi:MAG: alpha/beta fold hydrolase [Alphaproteobacteria bacterium]|uniref:Alpha/beta fold hydrolase n=1 Tax=Candidatus Nitrobium versatile TaxID=2884831 RepID=A0A953JAN5_9BACT|nr:alpha/beta fold hydrolase [Candidatus Nitrobium versatile]
MERKVLEVKGIRMSWEEHGEGLPVIYLHGIPTSPGLWRHVVPSVAATRALAWEMVGYGGSIPEGKGRDISVRSQADYLVSWMQAAGVERALLVGHDLGGGVAQIVVVRYPERVLGLVLMNAVCYDSWPIPEVKVMQTAGMLMERLPEKAFSFIFRQFLSQGHDRPGRAEESLAVHWPYYAAAGGASAFIRQIRSLDVRDTLSISDQLSHVKIPARLVWGAADRFQKIGYGYRLAHDLRAPLERIEEGKHFVPEDHPERVAQNINMLLEQLRSV